MSIRQEMDTFTSVKRMPDFVVADPKSTALIPVPETHLVPVSPAQTAQSSIVFPKENILTASSQLPRRGFIRRVIGNPEKETVHSVAVSDEHAILVNHQFTGNAITRRDFLRNSAQAAAYVFGAKPIVDSIDALQKLAGTGTQRGFTTTTPTYASINSSTVGVQTAAFSDLGCPADGESQNKAIAQLKAELKVRYGVYIYSGDLTDEEKRAKFSGQKLTACEELNAIYSLKKELAKYPPTYIRYTKLDEIRLIKKLKQDGNDWGGKACSSRSEACPIENSFFVELDDNGEPWGFHHELNHLAIKREQKFPIGDAEWVNLNGPEGAELYEYQWPLPAFNLFDRRTWKYFDINSRPQGFAERYGTVDADEDQATVAWWLMNKYQDIMNIAQSDSILYAKISLMKKRMKERSGNLMGEDYWNDLANGKVGENYWMNRGH